MKAAKIRQFVLALALITAGLLFLEGVARLLESQILSISPPDPHRPGWQAELFGSLFEWHERDPDLLWRFKAGLDNPLITTNADHLLGPDVSRRKPANTYRVLIAGDSSPVGLGLASRRQTFGEVLLYFLDYHLAPGKQVEVINGAVSGFSSEQVRRFLELKGWGYDPDLVVIYCGNNDASLSGPLTDRELLAGQKFRFLRRWLSHLATYRLMRCLLQTGKAVSDKEAAPKVRVSPERYGANLRAIAEQGHKRRRPIIFLMPPVPYLWPAGLQFKPFIHVTGTDGRVLMPEAIATYLGQDIAYCLDEERFREIYGEGDIFTREVYKAAHSDSLSPDEALAFYEALMLREPENPAWPNNLGVARWRKGQYVRAEAAFKKALELFRVQHPDFDSPLIKAAASPILYNHGINYLSRGSDGDISYLDRASPAYAYLDSALQADYFSLRIKRPYLMELEQLRGKPETAVIELSRIFRESGGERLFIDHCHPTAEGHRLIAKAIFDTIRGRRW